MLQMSFQKTVGKNNYTFTVQGENLFQLVKEAQKVAFNSVYKCGLCASDKLYLYAYTTKEGEFEYVKLCCAECKGQVTFGKPKKEKDTFYLRKTEEGGIAWEAYQPKEEQ